MERAAFYAAWQEKKLRGLFLLVPMSIWPSYALRRVRRAAHDVGARTDVGIGRIKA